MGQRLSDVEARVAEAFASGTDCDLSDGPDRTLRGDALARILVEDVVELPPGPRAALKLTGAEVVGPVVLEGATVARPVTMTGCTFDTAPNLVDASVHTLRLPGCHVPGLRATNVEVRGSLELNKGFTSTRQIDLFGAHVAGALSLKDAHLTASDDDVVNGARTALAASRMTVDGALLASALVTDGQVRLISTRIEGLLSLNGAHIANPGGIAVQGERLEVGESLFLQRDFTARGRVFLQNARIEGGVDGLGARFAGGDEERACVHLAGAKIGRNVSLAEATIDGSVQVRAAAIGGHLTLRGATFVGPDRWLGARRTGATAVNLRCAVPPAVIDLSQSRVDVIEDDPASWPVSLRLHGCTYQMIDTPEPVPVTARLSWLCRDLDHYRPQPYDQLLGSYRTLGDDPAANRVGLEKQRQRRATLSVPGRALGLLQDVTVGYGYRAWLAAMWMVPIVVLGALVFADQRPAPGRDAPPFQPAVFALDLLLPIVDLGQGSAFTPTGWSRWVGWLLVVSGWTLTTAVVAGLTRLLDRR